MTWPIEPGLIVTIATAVVTIASVVATMRANQRNLDQRFDDNKQILEKRFSAIDRRLDEIEQDIKDDRRDAETARSGLHGMLTVVQAQLAEYKVEAAKDFTSLAVSRDIKAEILRTVDGWGSKIIELIKDRVAVNR